MYMRKPNLHIYLQVTMLYICACLVALVCVCAQPAFSDDDLGNIVFASILFRHGDRSPISSYKNDPYNQREIWPLGSGQLTPIGREQHFNLGSYLRSRYSDFLPELYSPDDIFVRSSDVDRTLMSAECDLYGLYPRNDKYTTENVHYQPIPIHTTSSSNDYIFDTSSLCSKFSKTHDLVKKSKSYQCIMDITSEVRNAITNYTGEKSYLYTIYDILHIEELYNLTLPDWTKDYYPEPMRSLYLLNDFLSEAGARELQKLYSGPLLGQMVSNMQKKSSGTLSPNRKLFIYSGHDSTVSNLLMNLGVFNELLVPYASGVLVELREKNDDYYVTVSYRNSSDHEPYLLTLPQCDALCPLGSFVNLTKSSIPDDFDTECKEDPDPDVSFSISTFGIPSEWLQCFPKGLTQDGKYAYISL